MGFVERAVAEMIEQGLVEEIEPGVIQKLNGHGVKLDYSQFQYAPGLDPEDITDDELTGLKVMLLAIMEAPEVMGSPVDEMPEWLSAQIPEWLDDDE